jgi:hypothetical protein
MGESLQPARGMNAASRTQKIGWMPRWIVTCAACDREFTVTPVPQIAPERESRDPFASPPKPKIPEEGLSMKCPNCGGVSTYKLFDLRYRR